MANAETAAPAAEGLSGTHVQPDAARPAPNFLDGQENGSRWSPHARCPA
jgi:hypothetical protein